MGPAPMMRIDLMSVRFGMGVSFFSRAKGGLARRRAAVTDQIAG